MTMYHSRFFSALQKHMPGALSGSGRRAGMTAVLEGWRRIEPEADARHVAYSLATAYHETAFTMQPVRETLAKTDAAAISILERAFRDGRLKGVKTPYWRPEADGKSWLGRGLVQLTHRRNYEAMSRLVGIDLVEKPERAMEMETAVVILIEGMRRGSFTGTALRDHFDATRHDWVAARRIINGMDRAESIAAHARKFHAALSDASG